MCDDDHGTPDPHDIQDPALDPVLSGHFRPSRRTMLRASGAAVVAAATRPLWLPTSAWGASRTSLTGANPIRNAMHVHGSWSEQAGSWESQFAQAASVGTDVLWMTDHDFRALAYKYMPSLNGIAMDTSQTGSLAQHTTTNNAGVVRVLAESSSSSTPASVSSSVQVSPYALNQLRTAIVGQQLTLAFPACRIDTGGMYEAVIALSNHPAYGTRPAGQFTLRYRFGNFAKARFVDSSGVTGIVTNPTPANAAQFTFDLTSDVAALWPDMLAMDNTFGMLTLTATSPAKGKVVDVSITAGFARSQNTSDALIANQKTIVSTYGPRYPAMTVYPTVEISRIDPHVNPFGVPQFWPAQSGITSKNHDSAYNAITASVHSQGGLVSWNHAFGAGTGPLLSTADQATKRRQVYASMIADKRLGTDILEVGYTLRGMVNTQTHLDLWDTFSRQAIFITGNGANDDHSGLHWATLNNGFATGIWAASPKQSDLVAALASGRAYTYLVSKFANGQLDLLVDNTVPMGKVSVSSATSRTLAIFAANLGKTAHVDVVQGPVDYTGTDPGTSVIASIAASKFGGSGTVSLPVNTSSSSFVRVQVRTASGAISGASNPIWLLRSPPPSGIPAARVA
jgi:hypothetical protein